MKTFIFVDKNSDITIIISSDTEENARMELEQFFQNNTGYTIRLQSIENE